MDLFRSQIGPDRWWGRNATFVFQTFSGPSNSSIYDMVGWGNPRLVYFKDASVNEPDKQ